MESNESMQKSRRDEKGGGNSPGADFVDQLESSGWKNCKRQENKGRGSDQAIITRRDVNQDQTTGERIQK